MKTILALILIGLSVTARAGEGCRLFLVPVEPYIKKSGPVAFDVYLYNGGDKPAKVQSLEHIGADWTLDNLFGRRLFRAGGSATVNDHPSAPPILPPKKLQYKRIKLDIHIEPGDLAKVHVNLKGQHTLRSNLVLLFRPIKR